MKLRVFIILIIIIYIDIFLYFLLINYYFRKKYNQIDVAKKGIKGFGVKVTSFTKKQK